MFISIKLSKISIDKRNETNKKVIGSKCRPMFKMLTIHKSMRHCVITATMMEWSSSLHSLNRHSLNSFTSWIDPLLKDTPDTVNQCYTMLKVIICNKLSNDLISNSKLKCGLFGRIISSSEQFGSKLSEFMYELPKNRMVLKCPVCSISGMMQKTWSHVCDFTGCHCTEADTVVCCFHCRIFNPTNLLNHVAPSIELIMQIWAIQY